MKLSKAYLSKESENAKKFELKLAYLKSGEMTYITANAWHQELLDRANAIETRFKSYTGSRANNPVAAREVAILRSQAALVLSSINK